MVFSPRARADAATARSLIARYLGGGDPGEDQEKFYEFYCAGDAKSSESPLSDTKEVSPALRLARVIKPIKVDAAPDAPDLARARNKTYKSPLGEKDAYRAAHRPPPEDVE